MSHFDILMERLKGYDEVTILELLDITTAELLDKFSNRVWKLRDNLSREIEVIPVTDEEDQDVDEHDGFDVLENKYYDIEEE